MMQELENQEAPSEAPSTLQESPAAPHPKRTLASWLETYPRTWVGLVVGLALLLRFAYLFRLSKTAFYYPDRLDPLFYFSWAREIAAGHWLGEAIFVQSPLYAYMVAVFIKVLGETRLFPALQICQILVGAGTCFLTIRIARRLFGEREALVSGLLVAVYGPFLFYEGMVMKTFLSTFLTVLLLDLLLRSEGTRRGILVLSGFVFALTSLVRDNFVLLLPLLVCGFFLALPGLARRQQAKACALFVLGAALGILPITLRNYAVGKEFALLTTGGGEVFYIGNNADANGRYLPPPFVHATPEQEHEDFIAKASELSGRKLTPGQASNFWLRQGLQWIGANPGAWIKLLSTKLLIFWNAYELPDNYNYYEVRKVLLNPMTLSGGLLSGPLLMPTAGYLDAGPFGLIAPLGLLGMALTWRRWRPLVWLYLVLFGYMATVLLFFNFSRFRVPIVPILCLFAASAVVSLWVPISWLMARLQRGAAESSKTRLEPLASPWTRLPERPWLIGIPAVALFSMWLIVNFLGTGGKGVFPTLQTKLSLGDAYRQHKDFALAEKEYHTGLQILGDEEMDPATLEDLGVNPGRMQQEVESERMAQGVNFNTVRAGLHFGLGAAWVERGKAELPRDRAKGEDLIRRGIRKIEEAAKLVPYPPYLRRLAESYSALGLTEEAEKAYRAGLAIASDDFGLHYDLAGLYYETGRYAEALKEMHDAKPAGARMAPSELADYHFGLGLILLDGYRQQGRALYHLQEALRISPGHREAKRIRELVAEISGRGIRPEPEE
ncbi:MAG TPA: glycosyltransferase family 39 protein [Candidatus Polarisedimenticolia bacterium]|nr:glycosyltransferase family 39 protein [Candidatus Polarisedimenticolia bacterium]